jgi:L-asparaginase II
MTGSTRAAHVPLVEVTRGSLVESIHHGSMVALAGDDEVLAAGDPGAPVFPRSSLKPMQAVAMVRLGLDLPDRLLALGAASHSGAAMHQDGAREILATASLTPDALRNVEDLPLGADERASRLRDGGQPTRLAQNCSGKHAAMLATCVANGWTTDDYLDPSHPLQRAIAEVVAELAEEEPTHATADGCGTPLVAISLRGLARAFQRIVASPADTAEARVANAMRAHPDMVGGEGRDVTALMRSVPGLLAKDGAEGVYAVALPDGAAVALKIADGAERARVPVLLHALRHLGVAVDATAPSPVLGGGRVVGHVTAIAAG